ncbi:SCO2583/SCO2584 N-terminal domain-containing protein [Kitasatospora sp. NBC_00458]|uniref:SCO2583/SCO2584 N-terminal domain-containing protein n=1 Tax=Kitasatospora sp. NBC_00458 TaxID=2903568 RepID=UPI002E19EB1A
MPIAEDPEPRPHEGGKQDGPAPSGEDGKDPFADLVLDEEFIRGASVKEQTGRTRMLAAQWKHTPPVDPGGRRSVNDGPRPRKRFGRGPKPVDAWGSSRPRRRPEWRAPVLVVLAVVLVLAALNVDGLRSWYSDRFGSGTAAPAQPVAPDQPTVDHPWAGSPAEGWPTGIAGFEPKEAPTAVGVFTAEQVAGQVKLVKQYLAAANLDPGTVAGGRPEAALALLSPDTLASAEKALARPSAEHDPTTWFSRFDGRDAVPVGDTYRLQGRISVEGDGEQGVLVRTDFIYVYPLRPGPDAAKRAAAPKPSAPPRPSDGRTPPATDGGAVKPVGLLTPAADVAGDTWTARTVVRRVDTFRFHAPARYDVEPGKIYFEQRTSSIGNSECGAYDGYYHPQFAQFAPLESPDQGATGPARDPYDQSREPRSDGSCGTVTRS